MWQLREFQCYSEKPSGGIAATAISPSVLANVSAHKSDHEKSETTPDRVLIKSATIISMDESIGDIVGDILIEGGKIKAVAEKLNISDASVIDAKDKIIIPGFVDSHRHMWLGYFRNIVADGSFSDYKELVQRRLGSTMLPEDVYAANLLSALGAIESGVTSVLDWSQISNTPLHSDAAIQALIDSGIRGVYAYGNPQSSTGRFQDAVAAQFPQDITRLRSQYFSSDDQLLTLAMAVPTGDINVTRAGFKAGRDVGAPLSIHVGMGLAGKTGLLEQLNSFSELASDITYIHGCTLNDNEWKLIRDTGGTVSLSVYTEMMMGHGYPPIQKVLDLGLKPSLSLDVETTAPVDFFCADAISSFFAEK